MLFTRRPLVLSALVFVRRFTINSLCWLNRPLFKNFLFMLFTRRPLVLSALVFLLGTICETGANVLDNPDEGKVGFLLVSSDDVIGILTNSECEEIFSSVEMISESIPLTIIISNKQFVLLLINLELFLRESTLNSEVLGLMMKNSHFLSFPHNVWVWHSETSLVLGDMWPPLIPLETLQRLLILVTLPLPLSLCLG